MLNTLTNFEKLMQEHEAIQANSRLIAGSAENLLVMANLQSNSPDLTEYQVNFLRNKRMNLKRALNSIKEGLVSHFRREEEVFQPLVGDLIHVLKREHQEVLGKLAEIDWVLLNISPAGILFNSSFIQQKVHNFCQVLNNNCLREDKVLELLSKLSGSHN